MHREHAGDPPCCSVSGGALRLSSSKPPAGAFFADQILFSPVSGVPGSAKPHLRDFRTTYRARQLPGVARVGVRSAPSGTSGSRPSAGRVGSTNRPRGRRSTGPWRRPWRRPSQGRNPHLCETTDTLTGTPGRDVDPSATEPAPAAVGAPPGEAVSTAPAEAGPVATEQPAAEAGRTRRRAAGLSGMVLSELQELAAGLGIAGTARMRKNDLIAAIKDQQSGGGQTSLGAASPAVADANGAPASAGPRTRRAASRPAGPPLADQPALPDVVVSAPAPVSVDQPAAVAPQPEHPVPPQPEHPVEAPAAQTAPDTQAPPAARPVPDTQAPPADAVPVQSPSAGPPAEPVPAADTPSGDRPQAVATDAGIRTGIRRDGQRRDGGQREGGQRDANQQRDGGQRGQQQRDGGPRDDDGDDGDGNRRRGRRFRDRRGRGSGSSGGRERFGGEAEPVIAEDDVLVPVAGILDILDNYAFVRTSGYLPGQNDVYVSLSQVRKNGLRRGDAITGAVRQPREGERRDKFNALVRLDSVNGTDPEQARNRPDFLKLTPLYPQDRMRLETEPHILTTRVIDLVMPLGKGQRALIVSPPKAGKTMVLQAIANAITRNNPECHLMVVLIDERPEEVTDMQRSVKGEVIASTFDRPPSDHTTVAELAIERAKRLVEMGHDVVVL